MNEHPASFPETLDIKQGAEFMKLGYDSMKGLVDNGIVPAVVLNQKHTVMLRDELVAYIRDEGRRQAQARKDAARPKREPAPQQPTRRARPRRQLPDLSFYEASTKGVQPASTRAN